MKPNLLEIKNLDVQLLNSARSKEVLQDLTFTVETGSCLGLVGESGSGKSMTALAIMQLLPQSMQVSRRSQILFHGKDLLSFSEKNMRRIRGSRIAMIFQDAMSALNPVFTIGHQIAETIRTHRRLTKQVLKEKVLNL